jgi:mono/diheme cytochrome c family protein
MFSQPSVKPYERQMPVMPAHLVSVSGGAPVVSEAVSRTQRNPVKAGPSAVNAGRAYYGYYCRHCHGDKGDARTPIGDSYNPKPTDLTSAQLHSLTDGELARRMVLGPGHEPVLASTVPVNRRWAIVRFVRTLRQ